jgi:hypothetical protein
MALGFRSNGTFDTEALALLQGVFDRCLRRLHAEGGMCDPDELGRHLFILVEQGVEETTMLEALALTGLLRAQSSDTSRLGPAPENVAMGR